MMCVLRYFMFAIYALCLGFSDAQSWNQVYTRKDAELGLFSPPVNASPLISWYITVSGVDYLAGVCQLEATPANSSADVGRNYTCSYKLTNLSGSVRVIYNAIGVSSYLLLGHVTSKVTRVRCIPHTHPQDNRYWNITVVVSPSFPQCTWKDTGIFFTIICTAILNPEGNCTLHNYMQTPILWNYNVSYSHTTFRTQGLTRTTCVFKGQVYASSLPLILYVSVAPNVTSYRSLTSSSSFIYLYFKEQTTKQNHVTTTTTTWRYSQEVYLAVNFNISDREICDGGTITFTCQYDGPRWSLLELYKKHPFDVLAVRWTPDVIAYKITDAKSSDAGEYGCRGQTRASSERTLAVSVNSCSSSDNDIGKKRNIIAISVGVICGCFALGVIMACCCCRIKKISQRATPPVTTPSHGFPPGIEANFTNIDTVDSIHNRNRRMSDSPPPYSSVIDSRYEISPRPSAPATITRTEDDDPPPPYPGK